MSDEERDVDVESDIDDDDVLSTAGTEHMTQAEKRAHHNALERKRRDHIKESFHGLRDSVPALIGDKASRAQILKQATDYIQYMNKRNGSHANDIEDLKHQNITLEQQVRALEKAKAAGTFAAAQSAILENASVKNPHSDSEESSDCNSDTEENTYPGRGKHGGKHKKMRT